MYDAILVYCVASPARMIYCRAILTCLTNTNLSNFWLVKDNEDHHHRQRSHPAVIRYHHGDHDYHEQYDPDDHDYHEEYDPDDHHHRP